MKSPLEEHRRLLRRRRARRYWLVLLAWTASLWLGTDLEPSATMHTIALFVHLASVIVGLGAALMIEYTGALWVFGRRTLAEVISTERTLTIPVWLGLAGMLASGALLEPDIRDPLTLVKLVAVLVLSLNGVGVGRLMAEMERMPPASAFSRIPTSMKVWSGWNATVSQAGWWTAVIIGVVNTSFR